MKLNLNLFSHISQSVTLYLGLCHKYNTVVESPETSCADRRRDATGPFKPPSAFKCHYGVFSPRLFFCKKDHALTSKSRQYPRVYLSAIICMQRLGGLNLDEMSYEPV